MQFIINEIILRSIHTINNFKYLWNKVQIRRIFYILSDSYYIMWFELGQIFFAFFSSLYTSIEFYYSSAFFLLSKIWYWNCECNFKGFLFSYLWRFRLWELCYSFFFVFFFSSQCSPIEFLKIFLELEQRKVLNSIY